MSREKVDDGSFENSYIVLRRGRKKGICGGRRKTERIHSLWSQTERTQRMSPSTSLSAAERWRRIRLLSLDTWKSLIRMEVISTVVKEGK